MSAPYPLPAYPPETWNPKQSRLSRLLRRPQAPSTSTFAPLVNLLTQHPMYVTAVEDIHVPSEEDPMRLLLPLKKGDTLKVLQRWTGDRWFGRKTSDGCSGFFLLDERVKPVLGKKARSLLDWTDTNGYGLRLAKGIEMEILYQHSSWWFWGRYNHAIGCVPVNYVELIPDETNVTEPTMREAGNSYPEQYPAGSILRCLWPKDYTDPRILKLGMHDIFEVIRPDMNSRWGLGRTQDGHIGLFAHSLVSPILEAVRPPWSPFYAEATVSKTSRSIAEPKVTPGEIIEVLDMRADGYWLGRARDGKSGLYYKGWLRPFLDRRSYEYDS